MAPVLSGGDVLPRPAGQGAFLRRRLAVRTTRQMRLRPRAGSADAGSRQGVPACGAQAGTLRGEALKPRNRTVARKRYSRHRRADGGFDQVGDQAMAAAGGLQAATTVFNTRPDCKDHTANEDKLRKILHLPLVT
jgi:hypothetical protein